MRVFTYVFCGIFITATPLQVLAAAKEPLILEPSSKWLINYANDSCRMARQFGEGQDVVIATFDRFSPSESFTMTVSGVPVKTLKFDGAVSIRFGPAEAEQKIQFLKGDMGKDRPAIVMGSGLRIAGVTDEERKKYEALDPDDPRDPPPELGHSREAMVRFIEIGKPLNRPIRLETGSLGPPLAALRKCTDELLTHWGIDIEKHAKLTRRAEPASSPGDWINSYDYPVAMLQKGQSGIVQFRLSVDTDGKASACHIQQSTRPAEFDEAVCKALMKRARFNPALDANGDPINSYWRSAVRFKPF